MKIDNNSNTSKVLYFIFFCFFFGLTIFIVYLNVNVKLIQTLPVVFILLVLSKFMLSGCFYNIKFDENLNTLEFQKTLKNMKIKIVDIQSWGVKTSKMWITGGAGGGDAGSSTKATVADFICVLKSDETFTYPILPPYRKVVSNLETVIGKKPLDNSDDPKISLRSHSVNLLKFLLL